jgi:formylglycine-generating enzyme required for sulfatase activity
MVHIPAGEFLRGSSPGDQHVYPWEKSHEQPQHRVRLKGYYIDVHEVTNVEFERFAPTHVRDEASTCDDCPVTEVTWFEAQDFCKAMRPNGRLPTEAEWERAAKGGGDGLVQALADHAWFSANSITKTQPVAHKLPNGFGLHDMIGNVREWTADWYDPDYYQQRVRDDPTGPPTGARRVERGGAFFLPARGCTPTIRYNHPPVFRLYFLGFRCAADE